MKVRFLLSSKETKILVLCFHIKYYTKAVEYCVDTVISGGKLPLRDNGKFVSTDVTIPITLPPILYDFLQILVRIDFFRIEYKVKKEAKNEYRRHP